MVRFKFLSLLLLFLFFLNATASAQLVIGQYEDEAPVGTWNNFGFNTAAGIGFGGVPFALYLDNSSPLANPALLADGPLFSATTNVSSVRASFFRYGLVNTGVLTTQDTPRGRFYAFDFLGAGFRRGRWSIGASFAVLETYNRPRTIGKEEYLGETVYSLDFHQYGYLGNINLSAAFEISTKLVLGIGVNRVLGNFNKIIREDYFYNGNIIRDEQRLDFKGFYLTSGLLFRPTTKLSLALVARSPYKKKAQGSSLYQFENAGTFTDVRIDSSASSRFDQPLIIGAGAGYSPKKNLRYSFNISYFNWSRYAVEYFEENRTRDFRNSIKIYGGVEFSKDLRIFGRIADAPFRIGFCYDPQPVKTPSYRYLYLTFSSGVDFGKLIMEIAIMLGTERSSREDLGGQRLALSLHYIFD